MTRHVVYRGDGGAEESSDEPDLGRLERESVTVSFPDGSVRTFYAEKGLRGVGFEFGEAGILVLRQQESDRFLLAFAVSGWSSVSGSLYRGHRPEVL
jgi:hypothetical protein